MQTVDMNSPEFQAEFEKTWKFVEKVNKQFGFEQNPNADVNEGVAMGLARNKLMYGKRYCPCFMVNGNTPEERKKADNRICPCPQALEKEIPQDGKCHCGIFCTPEYVKAETKHIKIEEAVHQHSRGLTKEEAETLLGQQQLDGEELEALMEARELGMVSFELIDTREYMEYMMEHIVGTDLLMPTSQFYAKVEDIADKKETPIIVYCHTGSRSLQVQRAMYTLGFKQISNLTYGIISYAGKTQRGQK